MLCPYCKIKVHKPANYPIGSYEKEVEEFNYCFEKECPFYKYNTQEDKEICLRAQAEMGLIINL